MNNTKTAVHPTVAELWRRLGEWCDKAEAARLDDEWIDAEVARNDASRNGGSQ